MLDAGPIRVYRFESDLPMRRFRAVAALALTAFFAVAGSFHHHAIPKLTHDHAGFCSAATVSGPESCAICKVAHTAVRLDAQAIALHTTHGASRLAVTAVFSLPGADGSLLCDSRAPPVV
jgi:hypothetical protein